jgi:hypothetical protein
MNIIEKWSIRVSHDVKKPWKRDSVMIIVVQLSIDRGGIMGKDADDITRKCKEPFQG